VRSKFESPAEVRGWLQQEAANLWPAALGSLNLRRSSCVRKHCRACLSGEKHASYVLYGRLRGRRVCLYVPEELVPELRRCLDHGRALQELLYQAGPRYLQALKQQRTRTLKKVSDEPRP
jgi:hypothetical protein